MLLWQAHIHAVSASSTHVLFAGHDAAQAGEGSTRMSEAAILTIRLLGCPVPCIGHIAAQELAAMLLGR